MWREWMHKTSLDNVQCCALFDMHDVVDTLDKDQAIDVGVDLDHLDTIGTVICSFGKSHRHDVFDLNAEWCAFVAEMDGVVFTDYRWSWHDKVDIYREIGMNARTICVRGDKGQVASLLNRPCLLFDDKEDNIDLVCEGGHRHRSNGVVVRRGRKARHQVRWGYDVTTNPHDWIPLLKQWQSWL